MPSTVLGKIIEIFSPVAAGTAYSDTVNIQAVLTGFTRLEKKVTLNWEGTYYKGCDSVQGGNWGWM